MNFMSNTVFY